MRAFDSAASDKTIGLNRMLLALRAGETISVTLAGVMPDFAERWGYSDSCYVPDSHGRESHRASIA